MPRDGCFPGKVTYLGYLPTKLLLNSLSQSEAKFYLPVVSPCGYVLQIAVRDGLTLLKPPSMIHVST